MTSARPRTSDGRDDGQAPALAERPGERRRGVLATREHTVGIGWHRAERTAVGAGDRLDYQIGSDGREAAQPALLPAAYEGTRGLFVDDRRSRRGEGQPPPRAFAAPSHRPGSGRAAALAERQRDTAQIIEAVCAELGSRATTNDAAPWKEEIEHPATVGPVVPRLCVSFAPKRSGLPPRAARASRCRTSRPEPAMCRRPPAGTATARAGPAGPGCSRCRGTRG